jgi:hypothetical protein
MEITINLVEVAAELAHARIVETLIKAGYTQQEIEDRIMIEDEHGVLSYKEDYQDEFNAQYDYYYTLIEKFSK